LAEQSLPEKVRDFLNERHRPYEPYEVKQCPLPCEEWGVCLEEIDMSVWKDEAGKIHIMNDAHRPKDVLLWMDDHVVVGSRRPTSKESKKRMWEKREEIVDEVLECIEKKKWDERFKFKSKKIRKLIAEIMWGDEVAKIVGGRLGVEIEFITIAGESAFESVFDSKGMSDEQILREIAKRHEALEEAYHKYMRSLRQSMRGHGEFKEFYKKVFAEEK
jgi:hypothetical protein